MNKINILIVDDHKIVRNGLAAILAGEENLKVVGEVENGKEALEFAQNTVVDIAIVDISMPVMNGIECTRKLMERHNDIKVLALTMMKEEQHVKNMIKAGASGYIMKSSGEEELLKAVEALRNNKHYFSDEATQTIMLELVNRRTQKSQKQEKPTLTPRESEVLELIIQEYTNQEIADKLFISIRTVDVHRRNLLKKTGVRNTAGLVRFAMEDDLLN